MTEANAYEQLMLELINRARLDPAGEADRYGIKLNKGLSSGTIKATAKEPLAMNDALLKAARDHSQWMLDTNTFGHAGAGGSDGASRASAAGYSYSRFGENIAWVGITAPLDKTRAIYEQHQELFLSKGHRTTTLSDDYREVGVGNVTGKFKNGNNYNASLTTEDFGRSGDGVFVTGVFYADKDGNKFYSVGEGQSGRTVEVGGQSTTSKSAGGYAVSAPKAVVTVTIDGSMKVTVDTRDGNAKVDLVDGKWIESSATTDLVSGITHARLLGAGHRDLSGSPNDDTLIGNRGKNLIEGEGGDDLIKGGNARDRLFGGDGDDILKGGKGKDILDGGDGRDKLVGDKGKETMTGGADADTFVFKKKTGKDVVRDFELGEDRLNFNAFAKSDQKALSYADDNGNGDAVFDFGRGDKVIVIGVSVNDLSPDDLL